jgi:hypothetical protein
MWAWHEVAIEKIRGKKCESLEFTSNGYTGFTITWRPFYLLMSDDPLIMGYFDNFDNESLNKYK